MFVVQLTIDIKTECNVLCRKCHNFKGKKTSKAFSILAPIPIVSSVIIEKLSEVCQKISNKSAEMFTCFIEDEKTNFGA